MATEKKYTHSCTKEDLQQIVSQGGYVMMPSRANDEIYPNIVIGENMHHLIKLRCDELVLKMSDLETLAVTMATKGGKYPDPCSVESLEKIVMDDEGFFNYPSNPYDEVFQDVYIADGSTALNKSKLKALGITHIVNCAQGDKFGCVNTTEEYYKDTGIEFYAIRAKDVSGFNILPFLEPTANYIDQAIKSGGKVLIHCCEGFSRAPTVTTAYLMLHRNMDARDALKEVRSKREVCPNGGFMKILCELNATLHESPL